MQSKAQSPELTILLLHASLAFVCLFVTLGKLATVGSAADSAWADRDTWYTGLPEDENPFQSWEPVSRDRYFPVDAGMSSEAEALLRDASFVPISAARVSQFAKAPQSSPAGHQPYLLRGVLLNEHTGGFSLYSSNS